MEVTAPDQMYVHPLEFAQGSQWGEVVITLASRNGTTKWLVDPDAEPIPDEGTLPKGSCIALGPRMYTDDQLGKLDGPGRYVRKPDPKCIRALTPLAALSKSQRRKVRKLRRANKRAGITVATVDLIAVVTT